jgi:predicted SAM-dependent methyltransferase
MKVYEKCNNKYLISLIRKLFRKETGLNFCGGNWYYPNWVNMDTVEKQDSFYVDYNYDFGKKIRFPFADNHFKYIFVSHALYYFPIDDIRFYLSELYRILRMNGTIRISVIDDDLKAGSKEYDIRDTIKTRLNYDTLCSLLEEAGFFDIERSQYRKSKV